MLEINVANLKPGITFSKPLFDDKDTRITAPNSPLTQADIDFLNKWNIKIVKTEGQITSGHSITPTVDAAVESDEQREHQKKSVPQPEIDTKEKNIDKTYEELNYMPVLLESLNINTILNFDLYVFHAENNQYILYRSKNLPITQIQIENIKKKFKNLFILATDKNDYINYIEKNIEAFISNNDIAQEYKSRLLYEISNSIIDDSFKYEPSDNTKTRAANIINILADLIINDDNIFNTLISIMSENYTIYSHSTNVATYAINFSKLLGITDIKLIQNIGLGAFLHDIGKIKIASELVNKTEKLTDEEFEIIKKHSEIGYEIVREFFPRNLVIANIVKHHHEKLDGSGYPDGLKGDNIPFEAQIVSFANMFDALTSNKSYGEKLRAYDAFLHIARDAQDNKYNKDFFKKFIIMFSRMNSEFNKS